MANVVTRKVAGGLATCCGVEPRRELVAGEPCPRPDDLPRGAKWDPVAMAVYARCPVCGRREAEGRWPVGEAFVAEMEDDYGNVVASVTRPTEADAVAAVEAAVLARRRRGP